MTGAKVRRGNVLSVIAFESSKIFALKRTWLTLVAAVVVPIVIVPVLQAQARPPKDTLFGRFIHDSGWSIPLLLLGFAGQWLLPFLAAVVAAYKGMNAKGGPKGVGDAVNESVVISFILLFIANFVMSAVYFQLVPPKGG